MKKIELKETDCFVGLSELADGVVDLVITDPPYGTTDCVWDVKVDSKRLMDELFRVTKPNGAIVIFSDFKLAVDLVNAARKFFRYDLVWKKTAPVGFLNANRMPMRSHEVILVFYQKLPRYTPQYTIGELRKRDRSKPRRAGVYPAKEAMHARPPTNLRHPTSVLEFAKDSERLHPTQKPVALVEWLVKSFSSIGDLVLDPFAGSATTGVACLSSDRWFLGFEKDPSICSTARARLESTMSV